MTAALSAQLQRIAHLPQAERGAALLPLEVEHFDKGMTTVLVMLWRCACREAGVDPMEHLRLVHLPVRVREAV